jgi:GDP-L-fucose synthase
MQSHINVGFGSDLTIAELAQAMSHPVGYPGGLPSMHPSLTASSAS